MLKRKITPVARVTFVLLFCVLSSSHTRYFKTGWCLRKVCDALLLLLIYGAHIIKYIYTKKGCFIFFPGNCTLQRSNFESIRMLECVGIIRLFVTMSQRQTMYKKVRHFQARHGSKSWLMFDGLDSHFAAKWDKLLKVSWEEKRNRILP